MIVDPTTDAACLGQLTKMARELAPTTLMRTVARRLGSERAVVTWLRSLPQSDDDGEELVRYVACDVAQRVRLLPDDPNCFERAFGAIALLEVLDPATRRMLVTIERPVRHTGVVEKRGGRWVALDLFPRRNFDWGGFGKDALQGIHHYVGKPILSMYGLGSQADQLGDQEDQWIGRPDKPDQKKNAQSAAAKPAAAPAQPSSGPNPAEPGTQRLRAILPGSIASRITSASKGGGDHGEERKSEFPAAAAGTGAAEGDDDDSSSGASEETQRWGWG